MCIRDRSTVDAATLPLAALPASSAPAADVASQFDSWESYFYPDTIDPLTGIGTLRNLYDERDARVLSRMEYTDTTCLLYTSRCV